MGCAWRCWQARAPDAAWKEGAEHVGKKAVCKVTGRTSDSLWEAGSHCLLPTAATQRPSRRPQEAPCEYIGLTGIRTGTH
eukprot:scaffold1077_cov388-Prasinococcus_capsulatus_cf.AAC.14